MAQNRKNGKMKYESLMTRNAMIDKDTGFSRSKSLASQSGAQMA